MTRITVTRPPLLNSRIARDNLLPNGIDSQPERSELDSVFSAIDKLRDIWDGLSAVRSANNPLKTPQAQALEYKVAFEKAAKVATGEVRRAADALMSAREKAQHDALGRAGLKATFTNKAALQGVLRTMSKAKRDETLMTAIASGDHEVMAAIHDAHPLLIGDTTVPLATLIQQFVEQQAPDEAAKVSKINAALEHLELTYQQFSRSADKLRDKQAEVDGEAGSRAAKEAEAKLGLALQDTAPLALEPTT
ncbi:hypothetical protein ABGN05_07665 [Aquibium sp. LZ166]|uniref:Uncharacterized protein n=1 Tax=Aquibium pacificus TaxID=3153579 RepID=A0ABV3SG58_9HYPH